MRVNTHRLGWAMLWVIVCWTIIWSGLGYPSFWDPDEAHYAQTTKEMLARGEWLVPLYDGKPFFDKPALFHIFQLAAFKLLGPTEFAARTVSALSAMGLLAVVAWLGRTLFSPNAGRLAALMLAVLPATFALTAYAILDMTFTLFLFAGSACIAIATRPDRARLQYLGYVLIALAVLTKGPLGLVLTGLAFVIALGLVPSMRTALFDLHWIRGLGIVIAIAAPWFIVMWIRFGPAFIDGYALHENVWLYTRTLYGNQPPPYFYLRVTAIGLLPWTPLLLGRLYDAVRGHTLDPWERVLWSWVIAVVGFFSFSQFKLDHYIYPAAPALCLLAAKAWLDARDRAAASLGTILGAYGAALLLILAGLVIAARLDAVPFDLSGWVRGLPAALSLSGFVLLIQLVRNARGGSALPAVPLAPVLGMVAAYAVLIRVALPAIEQAKPVRGLARLVADTATASDHVGMYRLNRWSNSWRFYVEHPTVSLETPEEFQAFLARPGRHYCGMMRRDFEALAARGLPIRVAYEAEGLFTTTGRALRGGVAAQRASFVVVSDDGN